MRLNKATLPYLICGSRSLCVLVILAFSVAQEVARTGNSHPTGPSNAPVTASPADTTSAVLNGTTPNASSLPATSNRIDVRGTVDPASGQSSPSRANELGHSFSADEMVLSVPTSPALPKASEPSITDPEKAPKQPHVNAPSDKTVAAVQVPPPQVPIAANEQNVTGKVDTNPKPESSAPAPPPEPTSVSNDYVPPPIPPVIAENNAIPPSQPPHQQSKPDPVNTREKEEVAPAKTKTFMSNASSLSYTSILMIAGGVVAVIIFIVCIFYLVRKSRDAELSASPLTPWTTHKSTFVSQTENPKFSDLPHAKTPMLLESSVSLNLSDPNFDIMTPCSQITIAGATRSGQLSSATSSVAYIVSNGHRYSNMSSSIYECDLGSGLSSSVCNSKSAPKFPLTYSFRDTGENDVTSSASEFCSKLSFDSLDSAASISSWAVAGNRRYTIEDHGNTLHESENGTDRKYSTNSEYI